jgi:hypothetical protein
MYKVLVLAELSLGNALPVKTGGHFFPALVSTDSSHQSSSVNEAENEMEIEVKMTCGPGARLPRRSPPIQGATTRPYTNYLLNIVRY